MYKNTSITSVLCLLIVFSFNSMAVENPNDITQPPVSRRSLVCDRWQWIGGSATTWGCLTTPREAHLAGGQITDEVIASLQDQINQLKSQLKKNGTTQAFRK